MNTRKSLLALAVAGALITPAVAAQGLPPDTPSMTDPDWAEGPILQGEVAAVDHESGQLILATDAGVFGLQASPEDLQGVSIGDMIRVALAEADESD